MNDPWARPQLWNSGQRIVSNSIPSGIMRKKPSTMEITAYPRTFRFMQGILSRLWWSHKLCNRPNVIGQSGIRLVHPKCLIFKLTHYPLS